MIWVALSAVYLGLRRIGLPQDIWKSLGGGQFLTLAIASVGGGAALMLPPLLASGFLLSMAAMTVFINRSGLVIALLFVASLLATSLVSRWIRSTELRFQGFAFADTLSETRWKELCGLEFEVLVPHRPGRYSLSEKDRDIRRKHRLPPETPIVFIEVGWSRERPLAANLNFLLFGEGNIPWMVQELVRSSEPDPTRRPRIVLG
jgi:hypothetical protein